MQEMSKMVVDLLEVFLVYIIITASTQLPKFTGIFKRVMQTSSNFLCWLTLLKGYLAEEVLCALYLRFIQGHISDKVFGHSFILSVDLSIFFQPALLSCPAFLMSHHFT